MTIGRNIAAACAILTTSVIAEAGAQEKSTFHLFKPTPGELLREMSTDRPDKTESPFTVDAGHFQIEMDLINATHDHDTRGGTDTRTDNFSVATANLKAGLLNNVDLQLVFEPFTRERVSDRVAATTTSQSGFGDVTTRLKINLWGNDGGDTAFAMMPFVKFPTHQHDLGNDSIEGGVIFPLSVSLPHDWSMGLMTEFDFNRDASGSDHHLEFINSVTFSHDIYGSLAGYVEFFSLVSAEKNSDWIGTMDVGLTYGLTENLQLDAGINCGVTRAADDLNPFVGLSARF
ncbi:MAG: transporter [Verrucomicrobia bacterium]|nr:transporter [Verrucomicrobiota bacterium]